MSKITITWEDGTLPDRDRLVAPSLPVFLRQCAELADPPLHLMLTVLRMWEALKVEFAKEEKRKKAFPYRQPVSVSGAKAPPDSEVRVGLVPTQEGTELTLVFEVVTGADGAQEIRKAADQRPMTLRAQAHVNYAGS